MSEINHYYEIFGLKPGASEQEIVHAYKVLLKTLHPDKFSNDQGMRILADAKLKEVDEAFKTLLASSDDRDAQKAQSIDTKLEVKSDPLGSKVHVNGKEVAETPVSFARVRPGHYRIRVIKDGYEPYETQVQIAVGDLKVVSASLKKIEMEGGLVIHTEPSGAMVYLRGQPVGTSPYEKKNLLPGSYKVRVVKEGYEIWENDVTIQAGRTENVSVPLNLQAQEPKAGDTWKDAYLGMEFVFVKGGSFQMGDTFGDGEPDEKPVHEVHVDGFWMGKFAVTQQQWKELMNSNPSYFKHDNSPVEEISWNEVQEFISWLNQKNGKRYRLPTEAEWEYAARSGEERENWAGTSNIAEICDYAWDGSNSDGPHPVGERSPNKWGLFDMSGNVWEWVQDWYDEAYYSNCHKDNPAGPAAGKERVLKGGSCYCSASDLRISNRFHLKPDHRAADVGFRLVLPANEFPTEEVIHQSDEQSSIDEEKPSEGNMSEQSPKPVKSGMGIGAKIGLSVVTVLLGSLMAGLLRDFVGHGNFYVMGIVGFLLLYIWSRPSKVTT